MSPAELLDHERVTETTRGEAPQYSAVSASKAMQLLGAFRGAIAPLGVSELARRAGTSKSTAFRLLTALAEHGFVDRVGSKYELSWQVFELGNQVRGRRVHRVLQLAGPVLAELFSATKRSVHLTALDADCAVILDGVRGLDALPQIPTVGDRAPLHATASGKVLLAFSDSDTVRGYLGGGLARITPSTICDQAALVDELKTARRDGFARSVNEWRQGLAEVAAPVVVGGRVVAAISVSLPALQQLPARYSGVVRTAAAQLARASALVA